MPLQALNTNPAMPTDPLKDTMTMPSVLDRLLSDKSNNNQPPPPPPSSSPPPPPQSSPPIALATTAPLVNEGQLSAATGGAELSCYRCTVPFGVVVLIAGVVVTAVAYSFNSHGSTISYFGLVLLSAGLGLLGLSAVCWKVRLERKKERRRESQTTLMPHQRRIFV